MNILFLADIVPYPPNTGIKIRTFNIIKELCSAGNNVYLLAFNHKIFIDNDLLKDKYKKILLEYCKEVHILEIPSELNAFTRYSLYFRSIFSREPYRVKRYFSRECVKLINNICSMVKIDLCHADKLEFYKYSDCLKNIPIVATNHNIESDLMRQRIKKEINIARKLFAFIQWKNTYSYERFAINRVDAYITCSDIDADYFKKTYATVKPNIIIENGVDCNYYKPVSSSELEDYFLIIGAQNKESTANFDATWYFLNEIWPVVQNKLSCKIKIVGRNPDKSIIEYAKKDKCIEVIGFVDDERELFCRALALLVPLRIGGGSRLKILTAFGLGKAVISTTKGAEGIAYCNGKNILIGDTPNLFAEHMANICHNTELTEQLGVEARNLAYDRYNWEKLGNKLDIFYASIVHKNTI